MYRCTVPHRFISRVAAFGGKCVLSTAAAAAAPCMTTTPPCVSRAHQRRWCSSTGTDTAAVSNNNSSSSSSSSNRSDKPHRKVQIAVVGSGPSGCFVASNLTRKHPDIHVDILERMPVPYGLCRYGVAPDHPDVKNVEKQFLELFKSGRVTWIGNVNVGREIPLEALLKHYAAVVFATGAEGSRTLNIPGEDLGGVVSARDFVGYYNTLPFPFGSPRFCPFDLERTRNVAVIGNGNVAMDVVRVLSAEYKYYCPTDMNCVAVKELMKNRIRHVSVIGRRGVEHSAFAIAEFRELTKFQKDTVKVEVDAFDKEAALAAQSEKNSRAHARLMELVSQFQVSREVMDAERAKYAATADGQPTPTAVEAAAAAAAASASKAAAPSEEAAASASSHLSGNRGPCTVRFQYNLKPIRFLPSTTRRNYVGAVLYERTGPGVAEADRFVVQPCDLVLRSIGYRSDRVLDVPFDERSGTISNERGRVTGMPRVYCSGWVRNGAKGVILHSAADAQETVAMVLEDLAAGVLPTVGVETEEAIPTDENGELAANATTMFGKYGLVDYFVDKKLEPVSVSGLERILHVEKERGVDLGKSAEKMESVRDMLDVALGGEVGRKANDRVRGISPTRPDALLYLKELLDDDTDLAPLAHALAKEVPKKLAQEHPSGSIAPQQL